MTRRPLTTTMSRVWSMPSADTFSVAPIGDFVRRWTDGRSVIVDPFARNSLVGTHRNDLNPDTSAQWHLDAGAFCDLMHDDGLLADAVIFDPPYSNEQISRSYQSIGRAVTSSDTWNGRLYSTVRKGLDSILRVGGVALSFGWNSCGFGPNYETTEILLVAHGGAHNDTICMAQIKKSTAAPLFDSERLGVA